MATAPVIIKSTFPDSFDITKNAQDILYKKLCFCIQVIPNVSSHFIWDNKTQEAKEQLVLFKTFLPKAPLLCQAIIAFHPYDAPEIATIPFEIHHDNYFNWAMTQTDLS